MRGLLLLYCVVLVTGVGGTPLPRISAAVKLAARGSTRVGRGGKSGLQVITESMRETLIAELGYSIEEVDHMKPRIASVVIQNGLQRPRAGMPYSWRKSVDKRRTGHVMRAIIGDLGKKLHAVLAAPFQASKAIYNACHLTPVIVVAIVSSSVLFACSTGIWCPERGSAKGCPFTYHGRGKRPHSAQQFESIGGNSLFYVDNREGLIDDLPEGEEDIDEVELEWNDMNTGNSGTGGESWLDLQVLRLSNMFRRST